MRRKERETSAEFACYVVDSCEYATLAMVDLCGLPYCVPVSIVKIDNAIYFHSALQGFKIDCLKTNSDVCVLCVGKTERLTDKFSTKYESAIVCGEAVEVTDLEKKITVLKALCERHTPTNMAKFDSEIEKAVAVTAVWKIEIVNITGKQGK